MSKFASLTAGLLARKGEAEPASTPFADQLLTRVGSPASDIRALTPMHAHGPVHAHVEPGGVGKEEGLKVHAQAAKASEFTSIFGTFGRRVVQENARAEAALIKPPAPPALTVLPAPPAPALSVVVREEDEQHAESQCGACPGTGFEDTAKTFHVNLRLKRLRFVKLKLSAALMRRPVQDIVSEALDQWFEKLPPDVMGDCACLKGRGE
jgi:hypothetical protein